MNYITIAVNAQVATTIFALLAIELERAVYTGLDLGTQLGGVGMLELHLESFRQTRRSLICLQLAVIYHPKSHLAVLMVGKHSQTKIRRIDCKVALFVPIV